MRLIRVRWVNTVPAQCSRIATIMTVVVLACLSLFVLSTALPNSKADTTQRADNLQFLNYAFNLSRYGVFSHEETDQPRPTRLREPLYPWILSLQLQTLNAHDAIDARCLSKEDACRGIRISLMKLNIIIIALSVVTTFLVAKVVSRRASVGIFAAMVLVSANFFVKKSDAVALSSEPLAALLLLIHSFSLFALVRERGQNPMYGVLAGLTLGLLVLTKAIFQLWLYSLVVAALFGMTLYRRRLDRRVLISVTCLVVASSMIVGFWSIRNYGHFESFKLAERGGSVLIGRAAFLDMEEGEYRAGLCQWTPKRHEYLKRLMCDGVSIESRRRFYRDPDRVGSFDYLKQERKDVLSNSVESTGMDADAQDALFRRDAMKRILFNPLDHAALIPLFAYRGSWVNVNPRFDNRDRKGELLQEIYLRVGSIVENLAVFFYPSLGAVLLFGIFNKRYEIVAFLAPATIVFAAYSVLTHFIPRYSTPMVPILVICLALSTVAIVSWVALYLRRMAGLT